MDYYYYYYYYYYPLSWILSNLADLTLIQCCGKRFLFIIIIIIIIIIKHSSHFLGTMFRIILGSHGGGPPLPIDIRYLRLLSYLSYI
jgi:hypothetical protein